MYDVGDLPEPTYGNPVPVLKAEWLTGLWNYTYMFLTFFWVAAHVFLNTVVVRWLQRKTATAFINIFLHLLLQPTSYSIRFAGVVNIQWETVCTNSFEALCPRAARLLRHPRPGRPQPLQRLVQSHHHHHHHQRRTFCRLPPPWRTTAAAVTSQGWVRPISTSEACRPTPPIRILSTFASREYIPQICSPNNNNNNDNNMIMMMMITQ